METQMEFTAEQRSMDIEDFNNTLLMAYFMGKVPFHMVDYDEELEYMGIHYGEA